MKIKKVNRLWYYFTKVRRTNYKWVGSFVESILGYLRSSNRFYLMSSDGYRLRGSDQS